MRELDVAVRAAEEAGKCIMGSFGKTHRIEMKSRHDFVTETDLLAEKIILDILREEFPNYGILSEEAGKSGPEGRQWIVDPLDGTTNLSIGNPFFDVSIALVHGVSVECGVVHSPATGETFSAVKGGGAFLNGKGIQVSQEGDVSKLLLTYCNGPDEESIARICNIFPILKPVARDFSRMRAGALELAFVAAGRVGAYVSPGGSAWDNAAGALLVMEAGGRVTDFSGNSWKTEDKDILASNGKVHEKLLEILKGK